MFARSRQRSYSSLVVRLPDCNMTTACNSMSDTYLCVITKTQCDFIEGESSLLMSIV